MITLLTRAHSPPKHALELGLGESPRSSGYLCALDVAAYMMVSFKCQRAVFSLLLAQLCLARQVLELSNAPASEPWVLFRPIAHGRPCKCVAESLSGTTASCLSSRSFDPFSRCPACCLPCRAMRAPPRGRCKQITGAWPPPRPRLSPRGAASRSCCFSALALAVR